MRWPGFTAVAASFSLFAAQCQREDTAASEGETSSRMPVRPSDAPPLPSAPPAECARWTGDVQPSAPLSADADVPLPVTGVVDFESPTGQALRQEMQTLVDASLPALAECGLRPAELRSIRVVATPASVMEGRIIGVPAVETLKRCPVIRDLLDRASAAGWVVEDAAPGSLRVGRKDASPLPDAMFDLSAAEGRWMQLRASMGPATRPVTASVLGVEDEIVLQVDAGGDIVSAAAAWCDRAVERQRSLDLALIGECRRVGPTRLEILPTSLDIEDAVTAVSTYRTNLFETMDVHGGSMLPSLRDGDVVFVDKLDRGQVPPRGAVVLFVSASGQRLIKRVIGLPGERIELHREGVRIDGRNVELSKTDDSDAAAACGVRLRSQSFEGVRFELLVEPVPREFAADVPEGHVLLLGDNRPLSEDSRTFGPVAVSQIEGVARHIAWSAIDGRIDWARTTASIDD